MSANFGFKVLTGAIALAIGGTAMANTTLDGTSTGDVFINVVDTTNGTSFVYDTGVSQATFSGSANYSGGFGSDPNYAAFKAAEGSTDNLDFSVFSATKPTSASEVVYFSSSITAPTTQNSTNIAGGAANIGNFLIGANSISSSTTKSALLTGTYEFGVPLTEGVISAALLNSPTANAAGGYATDGALGTSLSFYEDAASRTGGVTTNALAQAGTWTVNASGAYSYNGGGTVSSVPLPTPIVLLLSGLGLMGVVSRRTKAV
jgi:hypothetical protein